MLLALSWYGLACTKGIPEFESIDSGIVGFTFGGQESGSIEADSSGLATIAGDCDTRIQEIKISYDNGATWSVPSGSDTSCADGKFSVSASLATVSATLGAFAAPTQRNFKLKGITKIAETRQASILVKYGAATKAGFAVVTASVDATSANLKIRGRIGQPGAGAQIASPSLKIKPGFKR